MGNTSWDNQRQIPVPDFFAYMQSQPASSLPASPTKPTAYERSGHFDQFSRRHSVTGQQRMVPGSSGSIPIQKAMFGSRLQEMPVFIDQSDPGFSELEDFSDDSSTCTNSPLVHRKVERSRSEPKAPSELINMVQNKQGTPTGSQQNILDKRYKTELCRSFVEGRECTYKEKCRYAHGGFELRQVTRHPKYRTEYCRPFHATGICSYGHRCNFIHNPEDFRQRRISANSVNERGTLKGSSIPVPVASSGNAASSSRPRAISLSAYPPGLLEAHEDRFIGDQRREMGSLGDSFTALSVSSGCASYPSSPLSVSPSVEGMFPMFGPGSADCFGSIFLDELPSVKEESGEIGQWARALNLLSFLE